MALALAAATGVATASPLAAYVDHARVLVISAPAPEAPELGRQDAELKEAAADLKARDVVVIRAIGPTARDPNGRESDAAGLRRAAGLRPDRFGVALVGKDGGVKLRRRAPVPAQVLVRTIDAMPMRREEMRRDAPG